MTDSEAPSPEMFDIHLLEPGSVRLFHEPAEDSRVRAEIAGDRCYLDVRLALALPLSDPDHYLGLRDSADKDIGVVREWRNLAPDSLAVAIAAMERSYLLPKVVSVTKVTDNFGVVLWDVVTDHGPRRYVVRNIRDNSVALSTKRVMMTDVEGERFEFPDIYTMSTAALQILLKVH